MRFRSVASFLVECWSASSLEDPRGDRAYVSLPQAVVACHLKRVIHRFDLVQRQDRLHAVVTSTAMTNVEPVSKIRPVAGRSKTCVIVENYRITQSMLVSR